jgi:hypothetical protein
MNRFSFLMSVLGAAGASLLMACGSAAGPDENASLGESGGMLLAGVKLTEGEVATLLRDAGFSEANIPKMVCTAKYESAFYERASNHNTNGSNDYGLFQINSIHIGSKGCGTSSAALYSPTTNTRCAKAVFDSQGIRAWYGYQKHATECSHYKVKGDPGPAAVADSSGTTNDTSGSTDNTTDPTPPTSSSTADGSCWSATLHQEMEPGACVNSAYNPGEYQCVNGKWYSGVENGVGVGGDCTSEN